MIANPHTILRRGVRMLLAEEPDLEVIGEASTASDAVALVRCLQPDVIIHDLFETGEGIAAIPQMRRDCAAARIVMLTHGLDKGAEEAAIRAGANAYVVNDSPLEALLGAVREDLADPGALTARSNPQDNRFAGEDARLASMTIREREVLIGVALGHSSKRIAGDLGRSVKTIEKHRFKMMHKLGLRNSAAVARYAIDNRLLDRDDKTDQGSLIGPHDETKARQV